MLSVCGGPAVSLTGKVFDSPVTDDETLGTGHSSFRFGGKGFLGPAVAFSTNVAQFLILPANTFLVELDDLRFRKNRVASVSSNIVREVKRYLTHLIVGLSEFSPRVDGRSKFPTVPALSG